MYDVIYLETEVTLNVLLFRSLGQSKTAFDAGIAGIAASLVQLIIFLKWLQLDVVLGE